MWIAKWKKLILLVQAKIFCYVLVVKNNRGWGLSSVQCNCEAFSPFSQLNDLKIYAFDYFQYYTDDKNRVK